MVSYKMSGGLAALFILCSPFWPNGEKILAEITSGQFAKEWRAEYEGGMKNFKRLYEQDNSHPVEVVGRKLRKMMPWLKAKEPPK